METITPLGYVVIGLTVFSLSTFLPQRPGMALFKLLFGLVALYVCLSAIHVGFSSIQQASSWQLFAFISCVLGVIGALRFILGCRHTAPGGPRKGRRLEFPPLISKFFSDR